MNGGGVRNAIARGQSGSRESGLDAGPAAAVRVRRSGPADMVGRRTTAPNFTKKETVRGLRHSLAAYKILLVQVGTLSFSHPSFGVPV